MTTPRRADQWFPMLVEELSVMSPTRPDELGEPPADEPGMMAAIARWTDQHPEASHDAMQAAVRVPNLNESGVSYLLLGLADILEVFEALSSGSIEPMLRRQMPRVTPARPDRVRWTLLTPFTDRDALIGELFGKATSRPKYLRRNPTFAAGLRSARDAADVRELLAVGPADVASALDPDRPSEAARRRLLAKLAAGVSASDPAIAAAMQVLLRDHIGAVFDLPIVRHLIARLLEVRPPGQELDAQFVYTFELPRIGWVALVVWDPDLPITPAQRSQVVAHIRYVADFMVSPWNRWRDEGDRRAALYLYFRRLAGVAPDIGGLAAHLRNTMPELYGSDTESQAKRRLYRISAALDEVHPPRLTQRIARAQATVDGQRASTRRRFGRRMRRQRQNARGAATAMSNP